MTRMRRFAGILSVLLALSAWLPAVVAEARTTEDGRTELLLWGVGPRERPQGQRRPMPNYVKAFQDENPDVLVVEGSALRVEGGPGEGAELMAIAGGTAPDVFDLFGRKLQTYAQNGFLADLDPYIAQYQQEHGEPYEGIYAPSAIWEACKFNGRYVGVPRAFYTLQLYWRKDLLRLAGVNPNVAPNDWDELFKLGMALTEPEGEVVVAGRRMKGSRYGFLLFGRAWPFTNFIWAAGGDLVRPYVLDEAGDLVPLPARKIDFREDGIRVRDEATYYGPEFEKQYVSPIDGQLRTAAEIWREIDEREDVETEWRSVFNEPAALEAFEFYKRLIHQPWTRCTSPDHHGPYDEFELDPSRDEAACPYCGAAYSFSALDKAGKVYRGVATVQRETDPDIVDQFVRGRTAMMICWTGAAESFVAKGVPKEQIGQAPMPPGPSGQRANFIAGGFYAINSQADEASREAAWRYIAFMTGKRVQRMNIQYAVESGTAIFGWPSDLRRFGFTDVLREVPQSWIDVEADLIANARIEPYCPGFQHVYQKIDIPLQKIEDVKGWDVNVKAEADTVVHYINTQVMGKPSEEAVARKNLVGTVVAIGLLAFFGFMFVAAVRALSGGVAQQRLDGPVRSRAARFRLLLYSGCFLGLALGLTLVWRYIPLLLGTQMAFYDWQLVGESTFIGFGNFAEALTSPEFWKTMLRTLQYVVISISMGFLAPIILALLLHEVPRLKMFFRTLYYLPAVTAGLVTMFLWKRALYDPSENGTINKVYLGVVNTAVDFLNAFGLELAHALPLRWLEDPKLAMFCIVFTGVWAGAGPGCLIYLAALKGVSEEQYEAAEIDGAGLLHKIRFITFPNLSALIIINFVGAFIGSFQAMQNIFVMTGGGPQEATYTIGIDIWYNAFMYLKFGYATAMAWILGSLLIGFTVYQLRILKKVEFKAQGSSAV